MNSMMNYDTFCSYVKESVAERMRFLHPRWEVEIRRVQKVNEILDCISITEDDYSYPNIYLSEYYRKLICGLSIGEILEEIFLVIGNFPEGARMSISELNFSESSRNVTYMLVNKERNRELLKNAPHRSFLDLAVIYRCVLKTEGDAVFSCIVNNGILARWGMTEEELYRIACERTDAILPPVQMTMDSLLCLTNRQGVNGASALMDVKRLSEAADKMDSDLYIIPSSVHEIFLFPADEDLKEAAEEAVATAVMNGIVKDEDWLSDHLYHFDRESKIVSILGLTS